MKRKNTSLQFSFLSFLALPLAFVGIPIYLNIADFYARSFGLNLALIGILLAAIRTIDAIYDPLIGPLCDKLAQKNFSRKNIVRLACLLLSLSFFFVFNPPQNLGQGAAIIWFFVSLALTYFFFSLAVINFESIIALAAKSDKERLKINSLKESFGIVGMILAFAIPAILTNFFALNQKSAYFALSLIFAFLILIAVGVFFRKVSVEEIHSTSKKLFFETVGSVFKDKKFLALLAIFLINGVAVSLPAANLNFYVRDVLGREKELGWFLAIYFLCACCFMPFWSFVSLRIGLVKTWILSIAGSFLTFSFAYFLDQESARYFYLICFLSGFFLGPDLISPPTLLARITAQNKSLTSSYFALWNFVTKISLMIAASGSLVALGFFGYAPGKTSDISSLAMVSFFYALLPCFIKLATIFSLIFFTKKFPSNENN